MNRFYCWSLPFLIFLLPSCSEWKPLPPSMNTPEKAEVNCSRTAYHYYISMDSSDVTLHRIPHGFFRSHPKVKEETIRIPRNETKLPELVSQLLAYGYYTGNTSLVPEGPFVDIREKSPQSDKAKTYCIPIDEERTGKQYDKLTNEICVEVGTQFKNRASQSEPSSKPSSGQTLNPAVKK